MHVGIRRIYFEVLFAITVLIVIPIFLIITYIRLTIDVFKNAPIEIEKIIKSYVYGE